MQSQSHEFSYFLKCDKDLGSLAEDYFNARPAEAEDNQLYVYSSDSSDETDQEIDSDVDFNFRSVIYLNNLKCRRVSCEFFPSEIKAWYLEQLIILRKSERKCILDRAYIV